MTDVPEQSPIDITEIIIPDPQAGIDESVMRTIMGQDSIERVRLGSLVTSQDRIIAALREQVAALRKKVEDLTLKAGT